MKFLLALALVVIAFCSASAQGNVIELQNADVLSMIAAKVPAEVIINRIETSRCHFDTFPTVISELRYRGVPEEILMAMVAAPVGRPTRTKNTRSESSRKSSPAVPAMRESELVTTDSVASSVSLLQLVKKPSDIEVEDKTSAPPASPSYSQTARQALTNDDLMKLLRGGTPATEIVKKVRSAKGNYDFSGKALFELQQAGADATVFLSMMEASRAAQNEQKARDDQNNPSKSSKP